MVNNHHRHPQTYSDAELLRLLRVERVKLTRRVIDLKKDRGAGGAGAGRAPVPEGPGRAVMLTQSSAWRNDPARAGGNMPGSAPTGPGAIMSSNTIRVILIQPDTGGELYTIVDNAKTFTRIVGGPIEAVYSTDGRITFFGNENGKISELPVNRLATALWWKTNSAAVGFDVLRGPVVITGGPDAAGETTDVPTAMIDEWQYRGSDRYALTGDSFVLCYACLFSSQ